MMAMYGHCVRCLTWTVMDEKKAGADDPWCIGCEDEHAARVRSWHETFEWTEWDDMQERVLNGEYDDAIFPEEDPTNHGICSACGLGLSRTASNPSGWVSVYGGPLCGKDYHSPA
jgi:hypothetical protein